MCGHFVFVLTSFTGGTVVLLSYSAIYIVLLLEQVHS